MTTQQTSNSAHIPFQDERFVRGLYRSLLNRDADQEGLDHWLSALRTGALQPHEVVAHIVNSKERAGQRNVGRAVDTSYHAPTQLSVTHATPKKILMLGSCLMLAWVNEFKRHCGVDYVQINNVAQLPPSPPDDITYYDFQLVQVPLRSILPDASYFSRQYSAPEQYERLFEEACSRMLAILSDSMRWNVEHGIQTFVCNILTPQQNPLGRLLPRYDLRNLVHFVERLNMRLDEELRHYKNAWLLDIEKVSSIFGKKYHQDDVITVSVHHGLISDYDFEYDQARLEPVRRLSEMHEFRVHEFISAVWAEALAMFRTLRGADAVKLIIMDLDDSVWRGIAAEGAQETFGDAMTEGWPVGLVEALQYLKNRGILLAIASKNDEKRITELWPSILSGRMNLDDFAIRKINWRPKTENIDEIMKEANLLPRNVVFVDDNPIERAAVKAAFPEIRVLGDVTYTVRQLLLWSPETQVTGISDESGRRTEMIQAQVRRDTDRKRLSRDEFLQSLKIQLTLSEIDFVDDAKFARAFELLNKTNQFNTTGRRWTHEAIASYFARGGRIFAFHVEDIYTQYGLVGVVLAKEGHLDQWAMSCRVIGLDVELAAMSAIGQCMAQRGFTKAFAAVVETDANFLSRDLFERCEFSLVDGTWERETQGLDRLAPAHVQIVRALVTQ
ncbi:HAD-IIIC family phosphatase [Paraburkholderia strydomiana]